MICSCVHSFRVFHKVMYRNVLKRLKLFTNETKYIKIYGKSRISWNFAEVHVFTESGQFTENVTAVKIR